MSKMGELHYDIIARLKSKKHPIDIAQELKIPVAWVYSQPECQKQVKNTATTEEYSPYNTCNS